MAGGERIDPWSSEQSQDYARIIEQFGLGSVDLSEIPNPGMLHRRGIVFAHRDLDVVLGCMSRSEPFGVLTGLSHIIPIWALDSGRDRHIGRLAGLSVCAIRHMHAPSMLCVARGAASFLVASWRPSSVPLAHGALRCAALRLRCAAVALH